MKSTGQEPSLGRPRLIAEAVRSCRVCGCTDNDCSGCIEKTGRPCYWVEPDLCSACLEPHRMPMPKAA